MASYEPKQQAVATSTEWKQSWSAPKAAPGSDEPWTTETPIWHVVVRGFQIVFGLAIAAMSGYLIHGYLMDEVAFALVCVSHTPLWRPWHDRLTDYEVIIYLDRLHLVPGQRKGLECSKSL